MVINISRVWYGNEGYSNLLYTVLGCPGKEERSEETNPPKFAFFGGFIFRSVPEMVLLWASRIRNYFIRIRILPSTSKKM
jgi:hypothetical protein